MVFSRDLEVCFPPNELGPLSRMEELRREGRYFPLGCRDGGGEILGTCLLCRGRPGFVLMDYICVSPRIQNGGIGSWILREMRRLLPGTVILCESEIPAFAPDPVMAERRLRYYARNGARTAGYHTEMFGVRYHTLYWAEKAVPDET